MFKRILASLGIFLLLAVVFVYWLSREDKPESIQYGMSFNTLYARELGLDWKETYNAIIDDMNVRHLRLASQWPMIEPERDQYNFKEIDYQIKKAEEVGADVIFAVGRRLPRWPECHIPDWAENLTWEEQKKEIKKQVSMVIERYKDSPAIKYWQVENEPYLEVFANEHCGNLDEEFLLEEIELVKSIDPQRSILLTDSGNLGTWRGAYKHGDLFGTSVYVYFWNPELGQFKTVIPAWFYRVKRNLMSLLYGDKEVLLIELSAEPWLLEPVTEVDIDTQYTRMNLEKFNDIIKYAEETDLEKQYLWGAEWWYWLLKNGHSEMWRKGMELFNRETG